MINNGGESNSWLGAASSDKNQNTEKEVYLHESEDLNLALNGYN